MHGCLDVPRGIPARDRHRPDGRPHRLRGRGHRRLDRQGRRGDLRDGRSYLVVDTGPWIFGKKVMLPAGVIRSIDTTDERVFVNRTKDEIKNSPEFDDSMQDDESYRSRLGSYYGPGRPGLPRLGRRGPTRTRAGGTWLASAFHSGGVDARSTPGVPDRRLPPVLEHLAADREQRARRPGSRRARPGCPRARRR